MFTTRMGSEKPGSEVLQNAYIEKEGSHRDHEKLGDASEVSIVPLMIAHLNIQQKENSTL